MDKQRKYPVAEDFFPGDAANEPAMERICTGCLRLACDWCDWCHWCENFNECRDDGKDCLE